MNGHTISTNIVCVNGKCKKTTNIHKNKKCDKVYDRLINQLHQRNPTRQPDFDELMDGKDPLKVDIPLISMPLLTKSHHQKRKHSSSHKRKHSSSHKRKHSSSHKRKHSSSHKRKHSSSQSTSHKRKRSRSATHKRKQTKLSKISKQLASLNKTMKQLKHSK